MRPDQIIDQVRYITKTSANDGSGTEADLVRIINDYYLRQTTAFVNTNEDLFGKKSDTNLNVSANQEAYSLPSDCMRVKRVEITYDGTNWYKVRIMDDNDSSDEPLDSTSINNDYSQTSPYADIFGNAIYLRPIPSSSVGNGLRIWYFGRPTLITNITVHTFDTPQDYHGYLAYGVASEVATRQGNQALATQMFAKWEDGLRKIEKTYSPRVLDHRVNFKAYPVNYT